MAFHETLPPRLVELVRQAKDQILARPELFQMPMCAQKTPCGTALCIGGHMAALGSRRIAKMRNYKDILNAVYAWMCRHCWNGRYGKNWDNLFVETYWPRRFDPASADSAAARIDYWLETGK